MRGVQIGGFAIWTNHAAHARQMATKAESVNVVHRVTHGESIRRRRLETHKPERVTRRE
jgi:hypothetical protein